MILLHCTTRMVDHGLKKLKTAITLVCGVNIIKVVQMQIEFYNDSNGELLSPEKILDFEWYPNQKLSSLDSFYETAFWNLIEILWVCLF